MADEELETDIYDVVIVGSGIAGMATALALQPNLNIALINKGPLKECSTYKAQGGMAVAVGADDSPVEHLADTLRVGQGLCNKQAVEILVSEGPQALTFLQSIGADFDKGENGLNLTREAGHSRNRIVHYFDYTGRHIAETMARETETRDNIHRLDNCVLIDILTGAQKCCGCVIQYNGCFKVLRAGVVVVATGGYSGLFARSTNSISSSGDGIAAAYRAGAAITDMEFVQFHPTTFTTLSGKVFLLTEALRGEGAVLLNHQGERFMFSYHPNGELAPRDEVSRAIFHEMKRESQEFVYLDARQLGKDYLANRFRQVYSELAKNDLFMEKDLIPIAPAAHYTIGGIQTDLWGRTTIANLYACGEAAATGVHGANRLASNSLLEGIVFGRRVAKTINRESSKPVSNCLLFSAVKQVGKYQQATEVGAALERVAGVIRRGRDMEAFLTELQQSAVMQGKPLADSKDYHDFNACQLAELLLEAALFRCESRGTHYREEYPQKNDHEFKQHIIQQWGKKAVMQ